jgi:hypothetical protein
MSTYCVSQDGTLTFIREVQEDGRAMKDLRDEMHVLKKPDSGELLKDI